MIGAKPWIVIAIAGITEGLISVTITDEIARFALGMGIFFTGVLYGIGWGRK